MGDMVDWCEQHHDEYQVDRGESKEEFIRCKECKRLVDNCICEDNPF